MRSRAAGTRPRRNRWNRAGRGCGSVRALIVPAFNMFTMFIAVMMLFVKRYHIKVRPPAAIVVTIGLVVVPALVVDASGCNAAEQ